MIWRGLEVGALADWVSGIGSLLAVVVALGGYWLIDWRRKNDDRQRRQDAAYQIGFKLSSLASDAYVVHKALNPHGKSEEELNAETFMETCGYLGEQVGFEHPLVRDLSESEQNLLMRLKEENFLMDYSEAWVRNQSIRAGMLEYKVRREALTGMLPPPVIVNGQIASVDLTQDELMRIQPHLIAAGTLVQSMRALSNINIEMLGRLGCGFHPMMKKHFPTLHIHKVEIVD